MSVIAVPLPCTDDVVSAAGSFAQLFVLGVKLNPSMNVLFVFPTWFTQSK